MGTVEGGKKTSESNKKNYGDDFYIKIGQKGGSAKVPKGFAKMDRDKVVEAGRKGGSISRRGRATDYL